METQAKNLKDILEIVNFIKDNAASKEDLAEVKSDLAEVKGDLAGVKGDLARVKVNMATKEDLNELKELINERPTREDFSKLQESVDNYAKKANDYFQEMTVLSHKVNRHEEWLQSLANKLEMNLEY